MDILEKLEELRDLNTRLANGIALSSYLDTVILRLIISLNVDENDSKTKLSV